MNIFNKITLASMKKSRTRTAVTILGVILSAAMITAVATFGVSLLNYMTNGAIQKYGGWHTAYLDADSAFAREQAANTKVADTAAFENIGYAVLDGNEASDKPYLFIAGFNDETFDALPVTLLSGRMPENSGEILIPGSISAKSGVEFKLGDTLILQVGNRMEDNTKLSQNVPYNGQTETFVPAAEQTYTVVGLIQTPAFEEDSAPGYTLITRSDTVNTADDLSLFVTLKNPHEVYSYVRSTKRNHTPVYNNNVLRFMGLSKASADKLFIALLHTVGAIVIAIVMIGSVFLIYNSFTISLNERIRQIGILASVGATAKQLRNSVFFEGICIGTAGIPLGIMIGIASTRLVISAVAQNFGDTLYDSVPLNLTVSFPALFGAAAVSLVTILISAYIPARKAARTPVMECIRQTNEVKLETHAVKISNLSRQIYGLEGILALKNFKRNKKRYRSIVLSLVLSIVLFVSTSAFVADLKQIAQQAKSVTDYDIGFGTQDMDDKEMLQLYNRLKTAEGVSKSSYQTVIKYSCTVPADQLSDAYHQAAGTDSANKTIELPIEIQFLDDNTYLKIINDLGLPAEEYTGQNAKLPAVAKMSDTTGQAENPSQLSDLFISPILTPTLTPISGGEAGTQDIQNVTITCVTTVPPDIPPLTEGPGQKLYFFQVMAPCSLMEKFIPSGSSADIRVKGLTFQSENPGRTAAEMDTIIQSTQITGSYLLVNTSKLFDESRNYIFIANVFSYTFIIMVSLIAAANVFNTISTNIKLRRRELAMLRSVGMSERAFNKMMRLECVFYGIRALLLGLPLSVGLSWLIYKGMYIGGADSIRFVLPWKSIGISVSAVLLVIFVTMMYAVSRIRKENIIDALRDDMT